MQDIWPLCLLIGALALFADIFVRRVSLDYAYPFKWLVRRLQPRETAQDSDRKESLARLRSTKTEVSGELAQARSSTRFESDGSTTVVTPAQTLGDAQGSATASSTASGSKRSPSSPSMAQSEEPSGYTARLLAAKKAAQSKKNDPPKQN